MTADLSVPYSTPEPKAKNENPPQHVESGDEEDIEEVGPENAEADGGVYNT